MKKLTEQSEQPSLSFLRRRLSLKHQKAKKVREKVNQGSNILVGGEMKKINVVAINNRSISIYSKKQPKQLPLKRVCSQGKKIDPSYNYTELGEKDSNSIEHLRTEPSDNLNNIKMVPSRLFYQDYLDKIVAKQDYASKIDIQVQKLRRLNNSQIYTTKTQQLQKSDSPTKQKAGILRQKALIDHQYKRNILQIKQIADYELKLRQLKEKMFLRRLKESQKRKKFGM